MDTKSNILDNEAGHLPDGWEIKKLGDIIEIIGGGTPKTSNPNYWNGEIPWISVKDFNSVTRHVFFTEKSITSEGLLNSSTKILNKNDIIISARGTVGEVAQLGREMAFNQSCYGIKANKYACNDYIYYLLKCKVSELKLKSHGSVFDTITRATFDNLDINLPPIEEQREIAAILSSLDDKIELNQQINKKLEEMAQAIFKEWFIDFNFPDENGNPYRDSGGAMIDSELGFIPASWSVGKLGDYVTIKRGGSPRPIQEYLSDCGLRWLKISDATATVAPFIFDIKEFIKESGISKTVLLNKGSLVLSNSATPGIPKILAVDSCIHDGWLYFQNSKFSNEFLYLLFKDIRVQLVQQGNGSVFTNLKTDIVKSHLMAIPNNILLNKFNELASIVFLQMKSNCQQINNLTRLRNMLLPKLISGFFNH